MEWSHYILIGFLSASLFFIAAALALFWAHRNGQLKNFDKGARSIFDEEEPLGRQTDHFPDAEDSPEKSGKPPPA